MEVKLLLTRLDRVSAELAEVRAAFASAAASVEDPDRDLEFIKKNHHAGRDAVLNAEKAGKLRIRRGPRGKIYVRQSDLDRWRASWPAAAKPRNIKAVEWKDEAEGQAQLEALLARKASHG